MLIFRILATVIMGLSCITCFLKNISIFSTWEHPDRNVILWTIYGLIWRAFVIITLWII